MANKVIQLKDGDDNVYPEIRQFLLTYIMTVGYIIHTEDASFNPNTAIGGTWEKVTDRFLVGAGSSYSVGATGGEATHTLTIDEMPSHRHNIVVMRNVAHGSWQAYPSTTAQAQSSENLPSNYVGGDQPHNNLPPYRAVYIWKRTA